MTARLLTFPADTARTEVSIVIRLIDEFALAQPVGSVDVRIEALNLLAIRNSGGFHIFTDLEPGEVILSVASEYYHPATQVITLTLGDRRPLLQVIKLNPLPSYPFPGTATLVRGTVKAALPVSGATVITVGGGEETVTDERGEFVLYYKGIRKSESKTIEIKKDGDGKNVPVTVQEGKTVSLGRIVFP
jgi:hypothetical protein